MAIVLKDRVKVSATTTGTGTFTLGSAAVGFQSFAVIGDTNQTYYTIAMQPGALTGEFEVGIGTVTDTAGTFTLSRDTVLESSNAGSAVDFPAGTKDVFVTYPAERAIFTNAAGTAIIPATASVLGVVSGGTGITSFGTGIATFLGTPSSANLAAAVTDETGSGSLVFATSPTLVTPALGTPSSGNLANCTFPTLNQSTTGNAATATTLQTARTINGVSFNGSANITITAAATNVNTQLASLGVGTAASGTAGEIRATNNITAYFSDDRLKTKLGNIEDALAKVRTLSGFYYEANETAQALGYTPIREVGVSAQQVQAVQPEIVVPAPVDERYLTVRYDRLIPLLIEAIKELDGELQSLKQQLKGD